MGYADINPVSHTVVQEQPHQGVGGRGGKEEEGSGYLIPVIFGLNILYPVNSSYKIRDFPTHYPILSNLNKLIS